MRIAVTGGSGQLGTLVLRRLLALRSVDEVVSLDLRPPIVVGKKLRAVSADVRSPEIARHFEGCGAVVHLAYVVTGAPPRALFDDVNVGGSKNVFRAAAAAGVARVVYSSSIAAYGVVPGHPTPIVESTPRVHQPSFAYAATKFEIEAFLDAFEAEHPALAVVRLRPAILVGNGMDHPLGTALRRRTLFDTGRGAPLPIVWDEDVADAVLLALEPGARGAFNLAADVPLSAPELARAVGLRLIRVPDALALAAARLSFLLGRAGIGRPTDPAWVRHADVPMIASSERARRELGWTPRCPTAVDVIRRYLEVVPARPDRRIALFFRVANFTSRANIPTDARHMDARIHLALTGEGGGDFDLRLAQGRLSATAGVPRPPSTVLTMRAETLLDLLAGKLDYSTAQLTGKVRIEGEALAGMLLLGMISTFRKTTEERGLRGAAARTLARSFR